MSTAEVKQVPSVEGTKEERNILIDQICASLGARYHDLRLYTELKK